MWLLAFFSGNTSVFSHDSSSNFLGVASIKQKMYFTILAKISRSSVVFHIDLPMFLLLEMMMSALLPLLLLWLLLGLSRGSSLLLLSLRLLGILSLLATSTLFSPSFRLFLWGFMRMVRKLLRQSLRLLR